MVISQIIWILIAQILFSKVIVARPACLDFVVIEIQCDSSNGSACRQNAKLPSYAPLMELLQQLAEEEIDEGGKGKSMAMSSFQTPSESTLSAKLEQNSKFVTIICCSSLSSRPIEHETL